MVEDNGFNPSWAAEQMKFKLLLPSLDFVQFKVMDKDSRGDDDLVGLYVLSVHDMAIGKY